MKFLDNLLRRKQTSTRQITVRADIPPPDNNPDAGAGILGNSVALFRPPINLQDGQTPAGMTADRIAQYLVATCSAMADQDLGSVIVHWKDHEGRFALTSFHILTWNYTVNILHPIGTISQRLAEAWELYKDGLASKVQEMHKGNQRFDEANTKIRRALQTITLLRDAPTPHMTDAEHLFLVTSMTNALVLSAVMPETKVEPEQVLHTQTQVKR